MELTRLGGGLTFWRRARRNGGANTVTLLQQRSDWSRVATAGRLLMFIGMSLVGLGAAPAMVSGNAVDGPPSADTWEILLAEARAQERRCGGDNYAASPPITWNDSLGAAAQAHSEDMVHMEQLSHVGSEGETLADRLGTASYKARAWAENVAAGQQDATTVVAGWLDSPGHCANIMSAAYTEFGAGVDRDASGARYWTLVLAAPRD